PDEPPLIPHLYLPFLGHVIGMFWHGASYFARVNAATQYPIYTLLTLTGRTIVVTDPALAGTIQKASKNTSFYGMILEVTKRLVDLDEPTMEIIRWNINGEHGPHEGLMHEAGSMVAGELSPGPSLNEMSTAQLQQFATLLDVFVSSPAGVEISLMEFVKRIFTVANAFAIYGPQNPFALTPSLVHDFWTWESGMTAVMANIFPSLTARKPYLAREAINAALQDFVAKEHYRAASAMIQKRVQINLKHGLSHKMAGHAELILLFGIVGNAVPTTFWVLANIFSRPELLARIREETSKAVICPRSNPGSPREKVISVAQLKATCPLLVSTYRETIRSVANLSSVRLVVHTHTVSAPGHRPYLLRKGAMVQIASGVIHALRAVWGPDAGEFNPSRFMSATTSTEQFSSAAYRGFGGGSIICPGRHFAQNEILGFVALCVHTLEVV
ncbi:cytochrome P450, partial [Paraphaeosphaeria sporulosa]